MKPYRVEYVQMLGWEADVVGLWLAENEDWLLLRSIPVDYVVDGYVILAKQHVAARKPQKGRRQVEQILKLKGIEAEVPAGFAFATALEMLHWVEDSYGVVEFAYEGDSTFFGWVRKADAVHFWIDTLNPDGTASSDGIQKEPFIISDIRVISFDTDYFNSLKMFWQHKSHQKLLKPSDN